MQRFRPAIAASMAFVFIGIIALGMTPAFADHGGIGGGGGGTTTPTPTPTPSSKDFALSVNYASPSFIGNLVRGATFGTPCSQCNGGALPQPAYVVPDPLGCFYDWNQISVTSLNGFTGTVNLSLPNLPAGITSFTAATISLPQAGSSSTPLKLLASTGASVGTTNVTLHGTSGALAHTVSLSLSIADQLPPCQ
jgi:hypothetical protein